MTVKNNELFTCPGQILCALVIDLTGAITDRRYSVIISRSRSTTAGYYLSFIKIAGVDVDGVDTSSAIKAKVFYIE